MPGTIDVWSSIRGSWEKCQKSLIYEVVNITNKELGRTRSVVRSRDRRKINSRPHTNPRALPPEAVEAPLPHPLMCWIFFFALVSIADIRFLIVGPLG